MSSDDKARFLSTLVAARGAVSGVLHEPRGPEWLELVAAHNVAENERLALARLARGRGLGGLAFEHDRPVAMSTSSGGQGESQAGAVAVPVHDEAGRIRAVVSVTFARLVLDEDVATVAHAAASLPR